jgi:hypothetical protein
MQQVYWWSEKSHSSAARAFTAAQSLHALVTAAVNEDSSSTTTSDAAVTATTAASAGVMNSIDDDDAAAEDKCSDMLSDRYPWPTDVLYRMLKGDQLQHGLQLSSTYAKYREVEGVLSEPQYTDATVGFTGTLDYVSVL